MFAVLPNYTGFFKTGCARSFCLTLAKYTLLTIVLTECQAPQLQYVVYKWWENKTKTSVIAGQFFCAFHNHRKMECTYPRLHVLRIRAHNPLEPVCIISLIISAPMQTPHTQTAHTHSRTHTHAYHLDIACPGQQLFCGSHRILRDFA